MSSLWTPDGERPIRREPSTGPGPAQDPAEQEPVAPESPDAADPLRAAAAALGLDLDAMSQEDREQLRAELEEMLEARRRTASVPAAELLARYLMQLGDVVTIYLEADPPAFGEAATVIEAIRGALDGIGDRLGEHEAVMREMLGQLQMIFVQVKERSGA
jgi:hypothetical protein